MKNIQAYIIVTILLLPISLCSNNLEYFLQANKEYEQGNYEKAKEAYQKITKKGPAVWHNLGFCYVQLNEPLYAKAYWRRAQKGLNKAVYTKAAQALAQYDPDHESISSTQKMYNVLLFASLYFSLWFWQILTLLTWLITSLGLWLLAGRKKYYFMSFGLLIMLFFIILIYVKHTYITYDEGIMLHDSSLSIGPGQQFSTNDVINAGADVIIQDKTNDWYKIVKSQKIGWLPRQSLLRINELT